MTESPVTLEWYISEIRLMVNEKLRDDRFVGNIKFEFNIKNRDITNMNIDTRKSLKSP